MGTVYRRADSPYFWIGWSEPTGNANRPIAWHYKSSGETDERSARKVLAEVEALVEKGRKVAAGPTTVAGYAKTWSEERGARRDAEKVWGAAHELNLLELHVFPELGSMRLVDVRPRHVRAWLKGLKTKRQPAGRFKGQLYSPRSIRNIWAPLHSLFNDAVADELLEVSPCVLRSGDMPAITDADPEWRDEAEYTRAEVQLLIGSELIPWNRRAWWALGFLTGMRTGETAALRWRHYRTDETPLRRLDVLGSYNAVHKRVKSTKTNRPRRVPVHPVLAELLDGWHERGWAELNGRSPTPDDLILTNERGGHLSDVNTKKTRPRDLAKLGLRVRRFHDARATFITLGTTDGADEVWLERVTHNAKGNQFNQYRRANWLKMCEAVSCLQIDLPPTAYRPGAATDPPAPVLRGFLHEGEIPMQSPETSEAEVCAVGGSRTHLRPTRPPALTAKPDALADRGDGSTAEPDGYRRNVGGAGAPLRPWRRPAIRTAARDLGPRLRALLGRFGDLR